MPRFFVDSSVLIAGAGSQSGASRAILSMAELGLFQLVVSRQVLLESERNLRKKLPLALPVFAELLSALDLEIVDDPPAEESAKWESIIAAKDAPILAAAVLAGVDRFVTLDMKDFTVEVAKNSRLPIQRPADLITDIRNIVSKELGDDE